MKNACIYIDRLYIHENDKLILNIPNLYINKLINCLIIDSQESTQALINCICGMNNSEANIYINNFIISNLNIYDRNIRLIPSESFYIERCTVKHNIMFGIRDDDNNKKIKQRYEYIIKRFNIENIQDNNIEDICTYKKIIINIAMSIITKPRAIIIDKTIDNIQDNKKIVTLIGILSDICNSENILLFIISNNIEIIKQVNNITIISEGEVSQINCSNQLIKYPKSYNIAENINIYNYIDCFLLKIDNKYMYCKTNETNEDLIIEKNIIGNTICNSINATKVLFYVYCDLIHIISKNNINCIHKNYLNIKINKVINICSYNHVYFQVNNTYLKITTNSTIEENNDYVLQFKHIPMAIIS